VALASLVALIRRVQPDIVHSHSSKAGVLGRAAAILTGCRQSFYSPQAYYGMAKPPWLKVRFFNWIESIFGRFGRTLAISMDEAEFAQKVLGIPRERITIIPNPVDAGRFRPATPEQRRAARTRFGIPEGAVVLATVGRMCWQKDPETAYAGVAPVCAENPDLLFFHLGWGKWREYLLGLGQRLGLGAHLRILDYTDDPCYFYHAIDALVVSSRYEAGWSLVFLEAMACNLPIVSSTCIGMSDIGRAGLSGVWTFEPEDVAGCTRAIRRWLDSHRRGSGAAFRNHRQFVVERLSPERSYGAIFDLYRAASPHAAHTNRT
jgi:glycosyltransferase involved in cell wall biosynthesis